MTSEQYPSANIHVASGDEALAIIKQHRGGVDEHFEVRPLDNEFPSYTRRLGATGLYLAEADNNITGTFKWRGASVATQMLYDAGWRSIGAYSNGNHSLGVAAAVRSYPDMFLDVFIPQSAPPSKQEGPGRLLANGQLIMHIEGQTLGDAAQLADEWQTANPHRILLPPFDNPNVIRGQGTTIDDILALQPDVQVIVAPTGGGGLAAGNLQRLEELGRTDIHYYGAEATGSNSMSRSLAAGEITDADSPNPRFGGSAVARVGEHVFGICKRMENFHTLTVADEEVEELIDGYLEDHEYRSIGSDPKEPTSLLAVAALRQVVDLHPGSVIAAISTGHNAHPRPSEHPRTQTTTVWGGHFPK